MKVQPGEYVAVVGRTGCGKSTLVRLLLGFEKPEKGTICYDGRDMPEIDLPSLRKQVGTVMQDAGLFQGSIYENIVITAPQLTVNDAWDAAVSTIRHCDRILVLDGGKIIEDGTYDELVFDMPTKTKVLD